MSIQAPVGRIPSHSTENLESAMRAEKRFLSTGGHHIALFHVWVLNSASNPDHTERSSAEEDPCDYLSPDAT